MKVVHAVVVTVWAFLVPASSMSQGYDATSVAVRQASVVVKGSRSCPVPAGWNTIVIRKPRYVIFGEIHGTKQAPAFVGNLACALASRGERVLVAVEHSSTENTAFQKAWRLPQARFASQLERAGWASRDDGVGSEAMLSLLVHLHQLSRRGQAIDIVAFNGAKDDAQARRFSHLAGQEAHEAAQAENISMAAFAKPYDHVLVLVGNIHARKRIVGHGDEGFKPMAMQLSASATVVTLNMKTAGGTAWSCQRNPRVEQGKEPGKHLPADAIVCGRFPVVGSRDLDEAPFIQLGNLPEGGSDADYDGFFWLGQISSSPPAVSVVQR